MNRKEILKVLVEDYDYDVEDVRECTTKELKQILEECKADLFPNGRDYESEDEDGV